MTWTTPHTYVVGELVTAATLNTDVRDNFTFLHSPPSCRVYNDANIAVPTTAVADLTFNSEYWDNATIHSTVTNTGRLTAPIDGVYLVSLTIHWATGSNNRYIGINLNASDLLAIQEQKGLSSASIIMNCSAEVFLEAGQFAGAEVQHTHGSDLNILAVGDYSPAFGMTWISEGT